MGFRQRIGNAQIRSGPVATPDVTVSLSGVSGAGTLGTLAVALAVGLTSAAGTGSVGSVTPQNAVTVNLTQVVGTGSVGSVGPQFNLGLANVSGTGSVGSFAPSSSVSLTNVGGTGSVGALGPRITVGVTQVAATGSNGSVTLAQSAGLSQVAGSGSLGTLAPSSIVGVTQVNGAGTLGTLGASRSVGLTQNAGAGSLGTLAPSITLGVTEVAGTGSVGNLTPPGNVTVTLSQVSGTGSVGSLASQISKTLSGVSAAGSRGILFPFNRIIPLQVSGTGTLGQVVPAGRVVLGQVEGSGSVGTLAPGAGQAALHGVRTLIFTGRKHVSRTTAAQTGLTPLISKHTMADLAQVRSMVESGDQLGTYARTVLASNPIHYWRMSSVSRQIPPDIQGHLMPDVGYAVASAGPASVHIFVPGLIAGDPDLAVISHGLPLTLAPLPGTGGPDFTYETWLRYDETRRLRFGDRAAITAKIGDVLHLDQPLTDFQGLPMIGPWGLGVNPSVAQYTGSGTFDGFNTWTDVPDSGPTGWPFVITGAGVSGPSVTGNTDEGPSTNSSLIWGGFPIMAVGDKFATSLGYSLDRHFRFVCNNTGPVELISSTLPIVGATYHVVVTRANTDVNALTADYALYVNGVLEASAIGASFNISDLNPRPRISGVRAGTPMSPIDGVIDEVAMYERALPAGEVLTHHLAGLDTRVPRSGSSAIVRTLRETP